MRLRVLAHVDRHDSALARSTTINASARMAGASSAAPSAITASVRQDLLDQIVWTEVIRLLEDPTLIQQELDRRLAAARSSDPTKQREQSSAARAGPRRQRHRTTSHRLSRGTLVTRAAARAHALAAPTRTDAAHRVAGDRRPDYRSRDVPALGRDPLRVPRPSAHAPPTRLTSLSANASCAWSSRTSSSATTPSSSGTAFPSARRPRRRAARPPPTAPMARPVDKVSFCVRGVSGPPCGVPSVRGTTNPSAHHPGFQIRAESASTPASSIRRCQPLISMSWLTRSKNFSRSTSTTQRCARAPRTPARRPPDAHAPRTKAVARLREGRARSIGCST